MDIEKELQNIRNEIVAECKRQKKPTGEIETKRNLIYLTDKKAEIALRYAIPIGMSCRYKNHYHNKKEGGYYYDLIKSTESITTRRRWKEEDQYPSISPYLLNPDKMFSLIKQIQKLEEQAVLISPTNLEIKEKLYSPLSFHLQDKNKLGKYSDGNYWADKISNRKASYYLKEINAFLDLDRKENFNSEHGYMQYYHSGTLDQKVVSLIPQVEEIEGDLFLVAQLRLNKPLTSEEMTELKSWWSDQLTDGWGECMEIEPIQTNAGALYIGYRKDEESFFMSTSEEFDQHNISALRQEIFKTDPPDLDSKKNFLEDELISRLKKNLTYYQERMMELSKDEIYEAAGRIIATEDAFFHMVENYTFEPEQIKYLLQFENPLDVVSDTWQERREDISDLDHTLEWVCTEKIHLVSGDYPLIPPLEKSSDNRQLLYARLDQNLADAMSSLRENISDPNIPQQEIIALAEEITTTHAIHEYLRYEFQATPEQVDSLLQSENPLNQIVYIWSSDPHDFSQISEIMPRILGENTHPSPPKTKEKTVSESTSVIAKLKDAANHPKPTQTKKQRNPIQNGKYDEVHV